MDLIRFITVFTSISSKTLCKCYYNKEHSNDNRFTVFFLFIISVYTFNFLFHIPIIRNLFS